MFSHSVEFDMSMIQAHGICYAWNATLCCQATIKRKKIFKCKNVFTASSVRSIVLISIIHKLLNEFNTFMYKKRINVLCWCEFSQIIPVCMQNKILRWKERAKMHVYL